MAKDFFLQLYSNESEDRSLITTNAFYVLSQEHIEPLCLAPTEEEVRNALWTMSPNKAPRPDGIPAAFYQQFWSTVKSSLITWIQTIFQRHLDIGPMNNMLISLIPKTPNTETLSQFRPIGLCNVNYKILTKLLVQCIKPLMPSLIGEEQLSFVSRRQTVDNIVIIQKAISLDGYDCLANFATVNLDSITLAKSILTYVKDGAWIVDELNACLPNDIVQQTLGLFPPCDASGLDYCCWKLTPSGNFSFKSCLSFLANKNADPNQQQPHFNWDLIWKWKGALRVQTFLWLVAHGRLLTNAHRVH